MKNKTIKIECKHHIKMGFCNTEDCYKRICANCISNNGIIELDWIEYIKYKYLIKRIIK